MDEKLTDLINRVQGASGADTTHLLVHARAVLVPTTYDDSAWIAGFTRLVSAGAYLDATLELCARVLPGWAWSVSSPDSEPTAWACVAADHTVGGPEPWLIDRPTFDARAPTPALALLLAMLNALQASQETRP